MTTIAQPEPALVTVGVDTHDDLHVGVALDRFGRRLGDIAVATNTAGYDELIDWAESFGEVEVVGVEGTGCYGAALARHLRAHGLRVVEVNRPNRQTRRRKGKSDLVDAEAAARGVQSGEATATPKSADDRVEMIRVLRVEAPQRDEGPHPGDQCPAGAVGHGSSSASRSAAGAVGGPPDRGRRTAAAWTGALGAWRHQAGGPLPRPALSAPR